MNRVGGTPSLEGDTAASPQPPHQAHDGAPIEARVDAWLAARPGWRRSGHKLQRGWIFADFRAAFAFMTEVAAIAEAMQHHPDWHNVYNRVDVELWTHDAGGLTLADLALAHEMDEAAERILRSDGR